MTCLDTTGQNNQNISVNLLLKLAKNQILKHKVKFPPEHKEQLLCDLQIYEQETRDFGDQTCRQNDPQT